MIRNADGASGQTVSGNGVSGASARRSLALLANVADMVTISDREGRIIYASPATQNVSGYTPEEFMALDPFDSIHPEDRPCCAEAFERLASTPGLSLDLEHRVRHKNGTWRWVEGTFNSLFDDPDVGGLLATVRDITGRKEAEERLRRAARLDEFRVVLADALRPLFDPSEVQAEAARVLGEHLGANRVMYAEVEPGNPAIAVVERGYTSGVSPLTGRFRMADFGLPRATAANGAATVVTNVMAAPDLTDAEKDRYAGVGIGAWIGVPLLKGDRFVAALGVHQLAPREWTAHEVDLVEETAERTWAAVERARAEERLRESEERYRSLFTSIDEGYALCEVIYDADGNASDARYLEVNPAFGRLSGLENAAGKTAREMNPAIEDLWIQAAARVAETGENTRLEEYAAGLDRWIDIYLSRVGDDTSRTIGIVFNDISERKRREANQAFLAEVTEDLSRLSTPDEIIGLVGERVGRFLNVSRAQYWDIDDATPVPGEIFLADFQDQEFASAGEIFVVRDAETDPRVNTEAYRAIDVRSVVCVPFHRNGQCTFVLAVSDTNPRDWRDDEIGLLRELSNRLFPRLERARAAEALRESEEHLQEAISIDTVGVLFFDLEGRMTDSNEAFARMTGYSRDELLDSLSWEDLTPPEFEAATARAVEELADRGETAPYEKQLVRKDGSRWWCLCAPRRLSGSGRRSKCVEFIIDITERKLFEAERASLETREAAMRAETAERKRISRELHDRVAHSMGVVYQSLQLHKALAQNAPGRAGEKLAVAEETAKRSLDQTRNLAIELRRSVVEETRDGIAAALWTLLGASAPDGVAADLTSSGDESLVPPDVGAQVYLVMREAVQNAFKHSGCDRLEASLEIQPGELVGTVTDDGDGFDPEAASLVGPRSGLGLGSMRERAQMVGGELNLTSHPGEGTTMQIRVPLRN